MAKTNERRTLDEYNDRTTVQIFEAIGGSETKVLSHSFYIDGMSLLQRDYSSDEEKEEDEEVVVEENKQKEKEVIEEQENAKAEEEITGDSVVVCQDTSKSFSTNTIFSDREALFKWCQEVGKSIGMVVVIINFDRKESGRKPRLVLACERSGDYRPRAKKVENEEGVEIIISNKPSRKTGSKKCGCPFRLKGLVCNNDGGWRVTVECGLHNHSLGENLIGHSYVGRFTMDEEKLVTDLTLSGVKPRDMFNIVKQRFPGNLSTKSTFYNFRAKHKLKRLQGRSQMQQMFKELDEHDYVEFHREDPITGECMDIFFAHPHSINMAKCFPEVIILDCTYKTIRQRLPLLEIVGFTSTMKTFAIAFVYLDSEKIDNFYWSLQMLHRVLESKASNVKVVVTDCDLAVMNAIPKVFPDATHLLCRWHVVTNIEGNYKKTFDTIEEWEDFIDMFKDMIQSSNIMDYEKKLHRLKEVYGGHRDLVSYIEKQWLSKYKERFVAVWTNSVMHFGTVTTNRAESMHASLKRHLGSSVNNLTQNWTIIDNLLESQLTEIMSSFNKSKNVWGVDYRGKPWMQVRGSISRSAMDMLARELRRSRFVGVDKEKCGCVVRTTCGIPCAHELSRIVIFEESSIPLSSIHNRWRKLDNVPLELPRGALDLMSELEVIKKKFDTLSEHQKVMMIKKIEGDWGPKDYFPTRTPSKRKLER